MLQFQSLCLENMYARQFLRDTAIYNLLIVYSFWFVCGRLKELTEQNPDNFYRTINPRSQRENLESHCDFIGTKLENTVFVENLTTGLCTVVKSLKFEKDDALLTTSLTYNAVNVLARESGDVFRYCV